MKYQTPKIVQSNRYRYYWALFFLVAVLAAGWGGHYLAGYQMDSSQESFYTQIDTQQMRIDQLEQELSASNEKLAVLERASQVDQEAMKRVKEQLAAYQKDRSKQDEELTFLRSMVATKDDREGLQIQRFFLTKGRRAREFRYRLTITQTVKNGEEANGWVFLAVDGVTKGKPVWLPLRDVTEGNTERLRMRFNNFQDIEGVIRLPEDFSPLKVIVEIKPTNKDLPEVKQRFDWKVRD